jgi:hypothetical protein
MRSVAALVSDRTRISPCAFLSHDYLLHEQSNPFRPGGVPQKNICWRMPRCASGAVSAHASESASFLTCFVKNPATHWPLARFVFGYQPLLNGVAKMTFFRRPLLALSVPLALAACTTATPYQPLSGGSRASGGYSDQRIEANRFRVTFSGNSMTSRETVERYLLYRAAELTRQRRYDWFAMADRATERRRNVVVDRPFGPGAYGYWGPSWRYYGRGLGWRSWDPFWGDPFWDRSVDVRTIDRYEATAEIVMGRGAKPRNNLRAFNAEEVLTNLGPNIIRPS